MDSNTKVEIGLFQLIGVVGTVALATLALGNWLLGGMREDVGRIHEDLSELRAEDRKTAADARTLEVDLKQTLAELTAELRVTNANLQNLDGSIASLGNSVAEVSSALVRSTERQQDFERWVAVRLGPIEPSNIEMTLPSTWTEGQEKIFDTLAEGSDPLTKWYSGLSTR